MKTAALRVAYQGEPGAYSEQASIDFFARQAKSAIDSDAPVRKCEYVPCPSFAFVFDALDSGNVDRVVLPIENSLAGTIHANLDLILRYPSIHIVGEHDFRVRHCLLALPGSTLADVKVVRSHFMALAQCTVYLAKNDLTSEVATDTAGSAKRIRDESLAGAAAIAGRRAADIYGLNILAEGIEDESENYTRFIVLARKEDTSTIPHPAEALVAAKTSIAFTLYDKPGALFRALSVFAVLDINLTKIESRHIHTVLDTVAAADPTQQEARRWGYVFHVDFGRSYAEEPVQNALKNLQEIAPFFRLLGSYHRHLHEETGTKP
jgi:arogenate/prephenate dehydratase